MLYWHKEESLANVKKQLINVLFGVPQISVLLTEQIKSHIALLKNHLDYWLKNKQILLHGDINATSPELGYNTISSTLNGKTIAVMTENYFCDICNDCFDLFNNGTKQEYAVNLHSDATLTLYDVDYTVIETKKLKKGVHLINIAIGGMAEFVKD